MAKLSATSVPLRTTAKTLADMLTSIPSPSSKGSRENLVVGRSEHGRYTRTLQLGSKSEKPGYDIFSQLQEPGMHRTESPSSPSLAFSTRADVGKVVVEMDQPGQPHRGKVFAVVHAHVDDVARYAGGLCAKLIREGYTGFLVRTTNDEKSGGQSNAQNILGNEQEHLKVAAALGCKDVFELYYQNHEMDAISSLDIRGRLILLFRYLKVDTVISFNPWGPVEGNPDHGVTGRAVEEAAWMCGM